MNGQKDYLGPDKKINKTDPLFWKTVDDDFRKAGLTFEERQSARREIEKLTPGGITLEEIKKLGRRLRQEQSDKISPTKASRIEKVLRGPQVPPPERSMLH